MKLISVVYPVLLIYHLLVKSREVYKIIFLIIENYEEEINPFKRKFIHFTLQLWLKPEKPQPDSSQDKPGLIARLNSEKLIFIPMIFFGIEIKFLTQ